SKVQGRILTSGLRTPDSGPERTMDLNELIVDLEAEQAALGRVLARMPAAVWDLPTHAPGWAVRDQVSHLASTDEDATLAIVDSAEFTARTERRRTADEEPRGTFLERGRSLLPDELLAWWRGASSGLIAAARGVAPGTRLPWFGPSMSAASFLTARLMETWSHGVDVVDVAGIERPATDRLRHIALLGVLTRPYSFRTRGLEPSQEPVYVELTAPSGERWRFGEQDAPNRVSGSATDF